MDSPAESLGRSPEWFPYELDPSTDTVSFIRLSRRDYEQASFLDARALTPNTERRALPWRQVAAAIEAADLVEQCGFIFHIGHVGSTLLSRLIGAHPRIFALREPPILRLFAQLDHAQGAQAYNGGEIEARMSGCLKLFSRTFDAQQSALLKATSFVSELAADLLMRASAPRALLMYVSPESYLATILGGPNSRREAIALTPGRLLRLHRRVGRETWRLESLSEGESVALGWACEMSALAHAAQAAGSRSLRIDFDRFLVDPAPLLLSALRHFKLQASATDVNEILGGPHMRRYSKAPEFAYDAALRLDVLNAARAEHGAEIRRGLAWLDRAAREFAPVRAALVLAETISP
jgi:hypothetical protein